jgi:hypothetical protein
VDGFFAFDERFCLSLGIQLATNLGPNVLCNQDFRLLALLV